ncbi:hypothetical protein CTEN210_00780 [Chaetoceros tenuissimus]|uniref:Uncharacterized protein n=1 Tax=Chaetoceros tenuissimus TaxID=426638 RepID=A0AAD3CEF9_9STRA|nr:hypothetical protein CTEN210_00780 [Chaetoceros tenuissimus]
MTTKTTLIQTLYQPSSTAPSSFIYKDTHQYKTRLSSFTPIPNFTLPLSLSPIILARFGWTFQNVQIVNNAPCMLLKCNCCRQELAITFSSDLNIENKRILSRQYRKLVAERHAKTCGFHMDACRWLVMADRDKTTSSDAKESLVPFYLLCIAKEYEVMEDCTKFGDLTRDWFRLRLNEYNGHEFDIEVPKQVQDSVFEILKPSGESLVDALEVQEAGESISDVNVYLTLFGWNVKKEEEEASGTGSQRRNVFCPLCLNECSLPIVNGDVSEPSAKRQKVNDDQNIPQFHLMDSHRYFCPMTCGFVMEENKNSDSKETVATAGWEIILQHLMKGIGHEKRNEEETSLSDVDDLENKKIDCSDVLLKIRESLRPMSTSPIKLKL